MSAHGDISEIQRKINEQIVLKNELSTIKNDCRVYQKQQNSSIFFLADKNQCQKDCQKTLKKLEKDMDLLQSGRP